MFSIGHMYICKSISNFNIKSGHLLKLMPTQSNSVHKFICPVHAIRTAGFTADERLFLKAPLDREKRAHYNVSLFATDWGNPPRTSSARLSLTVSDVNDCAPKFEADTLTITVAENNNHSVLSFFK